MFDGEGVMSASGAFLLVPILHVVLGWASVGQRVLALESVLCAEVAFARISCTA